MINIYTISIIITFKYFITQISKWKYKRKKGLKTIIGHDVWIGQNSLIKQGIKIGNGSVIGMGSIVTKDVAPYSIVGGNPSVLIRKRFSDEIINNLESSEWWNLSNEELKSYAKYIEKPLNFLSEINTRRRNWFKIKNIKFA